jgi:hypothetical protein
MKHTARRLEQMKKLKQIETLPARADLVSGNQSATQPQGK